MKLLLFGPAARRGVIALAACLTLVAQPAGALTGDPVEVRAILPLTGPGARLGKGLQQGLQLFEGYINAHGGIRNRPLRFEYLDDEASPQVAVQLVTQQIGNAQVVIGGSGTAECRASAPIVIPKGPVFYCMSPGFVPPRGSFVFSAYLQTKDLLDAQVRYYRLRGWTRIAYLSSTDASGQDGDSSMAGILAEPENRDVKIVAREHFNPTDISVGAQIARISAAKPQALIIWGTGQAMAVALHGIFDAGLNLPVAAPGSIMLHTAMRQFASFLPKDFYIGGGKLFSASTIGAGPVKDASAAFLAAAKASHELPDIGNNLPWDPALIITDALRTLGPDAKAADIRDFILNLHNFAGSNGFYDFRTGDQRGIGLKDVIITRWSAQADTWLPVSTSRGVPLPNSPR